jgi:hypothetical protein
MHNRQCGEQQSGGTEIEIACTRSGWHYQTRRGCSGYQRQPVRRLGGYVRLGAQLFSRHLVSVLEHGRPTRYRALRVLCVGCEDDTHAPEPSPRWSSTSERSPAVPGGTRVGCMKVTTCTCPARPGSLSLLTDLLLQGMASTPALAFAIPTLLGADESWCELRASQTAPRRPRCEKHRGEAE